MRFIQTKPINFVLKPFINRTFNELFLYKEFNMRGLMAYIPIRLNSFKASCISYNKDFTKCITLTPMSCCAKSSNNSSEISYKINKQFIQTE